MLRAFLSHMTRIDRRWRIARICGRTTSYLCVCIVYMTWKTGFLIPCRGKPLASTHHRSVLDHVVYMLGKFEVGSLDGRLSKEQCVVVELISTAHRCVPLLAFRESSVASDPMAAYRGASLCNSPVNRARAWTSYRWLLVTMGIYQTRFRYNTSGDLAMIPVTWHGNATRLRHQVIARQFQIGIFSCCMLLLLLTQFNQSVSPFLNERTIDPRWWHETYANWDADAESFSL